MNESLKKHGSKLAIFFHAAELLEPFRCPFWCAAPNHAVEVRSVSLKLQPLKAVGDRELRSN